MPDTVEQKDGQLVSVDGVWLKSL
ncbi:uncharacterized protein CELE_LLC1.2 [Caenorhabditis elegans]|nr:Secreted protein [Caenorhabditis elegans]CBK19461.1 Secreted protein [Caenorhabditis elegans]|eukprot:NP_001255809.1 Uncharacterized protein CELE_LLC1.2 [Caenorhabditis elegans]